MKVYRRDYWVAHRVERKEANAAWRAANQEHRRAYSAKYFAGHRADFRRRQRKYRLGHAKSEKIKQDAWRKANPEKHLARINRYRAKKAKAQGYDYTTAQHIKWRWEMWGGLCWMCGAPAKTTDHVIALSRGGAHWPANLRPACKSCNSRKHTKKISELDMPIKRCV